MAVLRPKVAIKVAEQADKTFTNFSEKKSGNKSHYAVSALLSGKGTGKSAFLDRHTALIREYCKNEKLKTLLDAKNNPLILNSTFNSETPYNFEKEATHSGEVCIARRLVYTYTRVPWKYILSLTASKKDLDEVLELIVEHHKRVNMMSASDEIVVILNVDELNIVQRELDKTTGDKQVREIAVAMRALSASGILGSTVISLLAGTARAGFVGAIAGSGIEYISPNLPLLNNAEIMQLMKECKVNEKYLSDPNFLHLLVETGGVPRVVRKVIEVLTMEYSEDRVEEARKYALAYLKEGGESLSLAEVEVLLQYILLNRPAPDLLNRSLVPGSSITFEKLLMEGVIFIDEGKAEDDKLTMPMLRLQSICQDFSLQTGTINRILFHHRIKSWEGWEMTCALFHSYKMQYLASTGSNVSMREFYNGVAMSSKVSDITIAIDKNTDYELDGSFTDKNTYQFPGPNKNENNKVVSKLLQGKVVLNGKRAPAGDCIMANPIVTTVSNTDIMCVRALCLSYTSGDLKLDQNKIISDHNKAQAAFKTHSTLFSSTAPEIITVHISNRELHENVELPENAIVVSRKDHRKFFGPTLQRGFLSPDFGGPVRSVGKPRYFTSDAMQQSPKSFGTFQLARKELRWLRPFLKTFL